MNRSGTLKKNPASPVNTEKDYTISLGHVEQELLDLTNKFSTETIIRNIVEQLTLPLFLNYPQLKKDLQTVTATSTTLQGIIRKQHTEIEFLMKSIKEMAEINTQIERIKIEQQGEKSRLNDLINDTNQKFNLQKTENNFFKDIQEKFQIHLKYQDEKIIQAQQQIDFKHLEQVSMLQDWLKQQGKEQMRLQADQNDLLSRMLLVEEKVNLTNKEVHHNIVKISEENHQKITNFELRFQKIDKSLKSFDIRSNSIHKIEAGLDDIQNRMIDTKLLTSFACSTMPILVHFQICEALEKVSPWSQKTNLINFEREKIKELKSYFDMVSNTTNALKILNIRSKVYLTCFAENDKGVLPFNYADEAKPTMRVDEAAMFASLNIVKLKQKADQFEREKNEFKEAFDQCMVEKEKASYLLTKHKIDRLNFEQLIHLKDSLTQSFMKTYGQLSEFQPDIIKGSQSDSSPTQIRKKQSLSKQIEQPKLTIQTPYNQSPAGTNLASQRKSFQPSLVQTKEDESGPVIRAYPDKMFLIRREDLRPYQRLDVKYKGILQAYQFQVQKLQNLAMGNFTKINLIQLETTKEHEFTKSAIDELQTSLQEIEINSTQNLFKLEENFIKNQQKITKKLKYQDEKINYHDEFKKQSTQLLEELKQTAKKNTNILRDQIFVVVKELDLTKLSIEGIEKKISKTQKEYINQQKEFQEQINKVLDKKIKDFFNSDIAYDSITKIIQEHLSNPDVDLAEQVPKKIALQNAKTTVKKSNENELNDFFGQNSNQSTSIKIASNNQKKNRLSRSETIQVKNVKGFETNLVIKEQAKEESQSMESQEEDKEINSSQNSPSKLPRKSVFQNKSVNSDNQTQLSVEQKRVSQAEKIKEKKEQERKKEEDIKEKQKLREQRIEIERKKREEEEQDRLEEEKAAERRRQVEQELEEKQKKRQDLNQYMRSQSKVVVMANKFMTGLNNQNDKLNNLQQKIGQQIQSSNNSNFQTSKTTNLQLNSPKEFKVKDIKNSEIVKKQQTADRIQESKESQINNYVETDDDEDFMNPFDFLKKQNDDQNLSPEKVNEIIKPQIDQIYEKIQKEVQLLTDTQNQQQLTNQQAINQLQEISQKLKNESQKNFSLLESSFSTFKKEIETFKGAINIDFQTIQEQMITEKREIIKLRRNMKADIENEVNKIKALDKENSQTFQFLKIKTQGLMDCLSLLIQDSMLMQMLSEQETIDRKQMVLTGFKKNHEILGTNQNAMSNNLGLISPGRNDTNNFWKLRNKNAKYDDVIQETRSISQTANDKFNILSQSVISNDNELINASFIDRYKQTQNYNTLFLDRTTQNQSVQLIQQIKLACLNYTNTPIKYGPINFKNQQTRNNQLSSQNYEVKNGTDQINTQINTEVQNSKDEIEQIIYQPENLQKDNVFIELSHLEILSLKEILLLKLNASFAQLPINVEDIFKIKEVPQFQRATFQIRKKIQNFNFQKQKQLETKSVLVPKNKKLNNNKQKVKKKIETQSTLQNDLNQTMEIKNQSDNNSQKKDQQNENQSQIFQLKSVHDTSESSSNYNIKTEINNLNDTQISPVNTIVEVNMPKFDIPILKKLLNDKQNAISQYLKERPKGSHYSIPKSLIDSFVDDQIQKSLNEVRQQEIKRQEAKKIEQSLKIMKMTIGLQQRINSACKSNQEPQRSASLNDMLEDSVFEQILQPKSVANAQFDKSKLINGSISMLKETKKINFGVKIGSKIKENQAPHSKLKSQLNRNSHIIPNVNMFRIMTPNQTDSLQTKIRYESNSCNSTVQKNPVNNKQVLRPKPNIPDLCLLSVTTNADKNGYSQNNDDFKTRQQASQSVTLKIGELSSLGFDNRPSTRPEKMSRQMANQNHKTISQYINDNQVFDTKKVNRLFVNHLSGEKLITNVKIKNFNPMSAGQSV